MEEGVPERLRGGREQGRGKIHKRRIWGGSGMRKNSRTNYDDRYVFNFLVKTH